MPRIRKQSAVEMLDQVDPCVTKLETTPSAAATGHFIAASSACRDVQHRHSAAGCPHTNAINSRTDKAAHREADVCCLVQLQLTDATSCQTSGVDQVRTLQSRDNTICSRSKTSPRGPRVSNSTQAGAFEMPHLIIILIDYTFQADLF